MTRYCFSFLLGSFLTQLSVVHAYSLPSEPIDFSKVRPASARVVLDNSGRVIDYWYGSQLRLYRPKTQIDSKLVDFVVWAEDAKFWSHAGFDLEEIKNSLKKNFEKGGIARGGSTITQQLAKNLFLDKERSFVRKLFEIPWAVRLEKDLKKAQILELYLNTIEWGPGIYGAEAACRHFFDRSCENLEVGQALYMAVIIPNPVRFDIFANPRSMSSVESRRKFLVNRLVDEKKVSAELKNIYLTTNFGLIAPDSAEREFPVSHKANYPGNRSNRREWLKILETKVAGLTKGMEVYLTIDREEMKAAEDIALVSVPGSKERYLIKTLDEKIVAFKKVPAGKTIIAEELGSEWSIVDKMPWAKIIRSQPVAKTLQ